MKKIYLLSAIVLAGLFANKAQAQISVHIGFNLPVRHVYVPAPQPEVIYNDDFDNSDDYYYLPEVEAYYSIPLQCYFYNDGGRWIRAQYLPGAYRNYDWRNARRFEVRGRRPYMNHDVYRGRWGGNPNRGDWNRRNNNYANRGNSGNGQWGRDNNRGDYGRGSYGQRDRDDRGRGGYGQPDRNQGGGRGGWGGQNGSGQQQPPSNGGQHGGWGGQNGGGQQQPQQPSNGGGNQGGQHGGWGGQNGGSQQQQPSQPTNNGGGQHSGWGGQNGGGNQNGGGQHGGGGQDRGNRGGGQVAQNNGQNARQGGFMRPARF
jgi:hypothetical protein